MAADYGLNVWEIIGTGVDVNSSSVASQGGWSVTITGTAKTTFIVTPPPNAPLGQYNVSFPTFARNLGGQLGYVYSGTGAGFQIVTPPPTRPAAGMPAFSWQGSVGGVNTGNGNKTTTISLVGWTMRGGMGVSCALIHNSQGSVYGSYGSKLE